MHRWSSVADVAKEFGIAEKPDDQQAVRAEVRRLLAEQHPDHSGGTFASPEAEKKYHRLNDALEYLDETPSRYLVPLSEITAVVKAVQQTLQPTAQSNVAAARTEYRDAARYESRRRFIIPRIGSGVFAAISAALVTFSGSLKDNPVFGKLLEYPAIDSVLLSLFGYSGLFFVMTWILEQRAEARAEWLASEAGLRRIFKQTLAEGRHESDGTIRFGFSDFCDVIKAGPQRRGSQRWSGLAAKAFFLQSSITDATAEKLARAHLDELERRGVAQKVNDGRLEITYSAKEEAVFSVSRT